MCLIISKAFENRFGYGVTFFIYYAISVHYIILCGKALRANKIAIRNIYQQLCTSNHNENIKR